MKEEEKKNKERSGGGSRKDSGNQGGAEKKKDKVKWLNVTLQEEPKPPGHPEQHTHTQTPQTPCFHSILPLNKKPNLEIHKQPSNENNGR